MLFNSFSFAIFLPVVWLLWLWGGRGSRKAVLLVGSYLFYAGGDPRFLPLLWLSTGIDYAVGLLLARTERTGLRRLLLALSLLVNLGVLVGFKYLPFALAALGVGDWQQALSTQAFHVWGLVPAGLSFYTFQTLSYTIDVYRKRTPACRDPIDFALFVAFFPQLIAGPILRADDFLPQLRANRTPARREIVQGAELFALGLVKKVVIADNIGALIDPVMRRPELYTGASVGVAALLFAAQIYCDFSGYSTMARGLAHLFGLTLPRNFDSPWMQGTPLGYRRGWHITIARWFGDYVFKPLGGTRVPVPRAVFNIMLLWLLFGIWHGAGPTFAVWGLFNGAVHLLSYFAKRWGLRLPDYPGKRLVGVVLIGAFMMPSFLFFRVSSVADGLVALRRMVVLAPDGEDIFRYGWPALLVLLVLHAAAFRWYDEDLLNRVGPVRRALVFGGVALLLLVAAPAAQPFIYYQF